jgi:hypothetical protein
VFTSAINTNTGYFYYPALTASTTTYPKLIIRHKDTGNLGSNPIGQVLVIYGDLTTSTFNLTSSTSFIAETFTLTTGKTLSQIQVEIVATGSLSGTFTMNVDFLFAFKETLTLPAASQPLQLPLLRRIADLQIPSREGSVLQDLGSPSPQVEVGGTLITTSSPNNYTGDQWWDVLVGVWLEANWQWFASDRVAYKYQITELSNTQNPGHVGYYDFRLRLKKVDILTATAQTFNSNTGGGAIQ